MDRRVCRFRPGNRPFVGGDGKNQNRRHKEPCYSVQVDLHAVRSQVQSFGSILTMMALSAGTSQVTLLPDGATTV